jgi:hypothetical protein
VDRSRTAVIRRQEGAALVTALMFVALMLTVSLAAIAVVDSQQRDSGRDRKRESTFQLSEGVLNTQIFLLSRQWPGTAALAYPPTCTRANATSVLCPDDPRLASSFQGPDYRTIEWSTEIRDNVGSADYYNDAAMGSPSIPSWDANGDGHLWVRSRSVLPDGRARTLLALVKAEVLSANFPSHAVVAGSIKMEQQGNHTYIWTGGGRWDNEDVPAGRVVVRCSPPSATSCAHESKDVHISPASVESDPTMRPAMTPETIDRMRATARQAGTYYAGNGTQCPTSLAGQVVFIENATGCTAHNVNNAVYNSKAQPGVLIIGSGHFLYQNPTYYGLVYHVNGSDGVGTPLTDNPAPMATKGNGVIVGAVIIDGNGTLEVGNNNGGPGFPGNIVFHPGARNALKVFGTAGIVQNSFREIRSTR